MLGMLYGEGDFKKSMIYAINCGDDTDCTGATLGALFGMMHGSKIIPEDWRSHIGDQIVTVAIDRGSYHGFPRTCTELTERVLSMIPVMLKANNANVVIYDGKDCFDEVCIDGFKQSSVGEKLCARSGKSYSTDFIYARAMVEFTEDPVIKPLGELNIKITFFNQMPDSKHINLRWLLPDGWSVEGRKDVFLNGGSPDNRPDGAVKTITVSIMAGETVQPVNRIILEASCAGRPSVGLIPITILG
jgi:hypothetical protein